MHLGALLCFVLLLNSGILSFITLVDSVHQGKLLLLLQVMRGTPIILTCHNSICHMTPKASLWDSAHPQGTSLLERLLHNP